MKTVDLAQLDELSAAAAASPRLRKNYNLHPRDNSACHRLFNAIEPGSYIRPHRHLDPEKDETFYLVRGSLGIVTFDEDGAVTGQAHLRPGGELAVDIPHGAFHTAIALEPGTIFFEAKAGPYLPLADEEKAAFAPEEGSPEAQGYLERLEARFRQGSR